MKRALALCLSATLATACGDNPSSPPDDASSPVSEPDSSLDAANVPSDDATTEDPTDAGLNDAEAAPIERVALPEGSRELSGVVNLVSSAAADQLDMHISDLTPIHPTRRHGLTEATNLFLSVYPEEYDFLYFFTDHALPGAPIGVFETVNGTAAPGGAGFEFEVRAEGYRSNGKLLGVIAFQHLPGVSPPAAHETLHFWANKLDPSFGFGSDNGAGVGPHWGYTSVHGQLGGFDGASLRCASPAGALPPACTPLASGRIRYVASAFNANGNFALPYSPLELYLMGLRPASAVPESFQLLEKAATVPGGYDSDAGTVLVEASGLKQIPFADILARHGSKALRSASERHFRAAFVVVSKVPASDETMQQVARWAAALGNRASDPLLTSFETMTSGLATMDTSLGARRPVTSPAPPARGPFTCDLLAQDCPRPELACFLTGSPLCALSGGVALDQPCNAQYACQAGLDCTASEAQPDRYVCKPYCNPTDASADKACQKICSGDYWILNGGGKQQGALCMP